MDTKGSSMKWYEMMFWLCVFTWGIYLATDEFIWWWF